jgi:hopanoid-associated phosphorylase
VDKERSLERSVSSRLALVVGLKQEAKAAAVPTTIIGGGSAKQVRRLLAQAGPLDAVLSFGIAGGLAPGLKAGSLVIAESVIADESYPCCPEWLDALARRLPHAHIGSVAGVDAMIGSRLEKAALHRETGALAADMESHGAAAFARANRLPFIALRAIADPCERALPLSAMVGMNSDGSANIRAVLRELARRPGDLRGLLQTAREARAALNALLRCRSLLGGLFSFNNRGEPLLDLSGEFEFGRPLFVERNISFHRPLCLYAE